MDGTWVCRGTKEQMCGKEFIPKPEGVEWLPSPCDAPKGSVCLTCAAREEEGMKKVDGLLKDAAEGMGIPPSRFGKSHDVVREPQYVENPRWRTSCQETDVVKELTEEELKKNLNEEWCHECGGEKGMFDEGRWWCWPCWEKYKGFNVKLKQEEKEWRKALLDTISEHFACLPGHGIAILDAFNDLRSRFLS